MHHVFKRPPGRVLDRAQRTIGWKAEADEQGAMVAVGKAKNLPGDVLVGGMCLAAADAKARRCDHHLHRRLAHIETIEVRLVTFSSPQNDRDYGGSAGDPAGSLPHSSELLLRVGVGDDDEVPPLAVASRWCSPCCLENLMQMLVRDGPLRKGANLAA